MGTVTTLPRGGPFTREELEALPDDGRRYELIDGSLVVTPAPALRHQRMVGKLHLLLSQACPAGLEVLLAPFDVALAVDTVVQPDLLVARTSDLTERELPTAPLLALEVLSPSTRHVDRGLKRARYETAGCPSYWVVDPDGPSVTIWELQDDGYVERAHVAGNDTHAVTAPFPVELTPSALVG